MSYSKKHRSVELSTSSMADIAFLMLIFFLVTTQLETDKGIAILLPPYVDVPLQDNVNSRNIFKVQINSLDQIMVEDQRRESLSGLRNEIKSFLMNNGVDPTLSESPEQAIVSLKADRGTSHASFVAALDEIQAAYYDIYSARSGITPRQFRSLDLNVPENRRMYEKAKRGVPMNISIAEPTAATR